jgi:hypothetical protein
MVTNRVIEYPEGDSREIEHPLGVNALVDLNGNPLDLPLPSARMIVYRVWKITTDEERRTETIRYHLQRVVRPELDRLASGRG